MKDYIEMTEDVLCRSKNIIKKKKRAVRAAVSSALCLCLVAVMGAGVWMTGVRRNDPQIPEETIAATEPAVTGDAVPTGKQVGKHSKTGYLRPRNILRPQ